MKTLVVLMLVFGYSVHAKNASCTAMAGHKLDASTNPKPNNPSAYTAPSSHQPLKAKAKR